MNVTPAAVHLIEAAWILPVEPAGEPLTGHAIAVQGGRVVEIGPAADLRRRHPDAPVTALPRHAVLPGLINLHTHAAMNLMRGLADDQPLMTWLQEHIWPAEAAHVSAEFVHDGTLLACAELLKGGVTCFNDMYFFPDAAARAVRTAGMRATLGMVVMEFASAYAGDAADYLHKGLAVRDQWRHDPRLRFAMAPHAPYTVSNRTFRQVVTYAEQLQIPIHLHVHETDEEVRKSLEEHGSRPIARLAALGVTGPGLISVHSVHLNEGEIERYAREGCHVAHCPTSNLKLASGIAPVTALLDAGVSVGLGTDGVASNNRLDLWAEMRLAALLAKGSTGHADAVPARAALEMATINGARALGRDHEIGSLLPGKRADMVAVDLGGIDTLPCYDVVSHLVYAAGREHVTHVWIDGELRVDNGVLTGLDTDHLAATAHLWQQRLSGR